MHTIVEGLEVRRILAQNKVNLTWLSEQLGISLEVLEYCIGQTVKSNRPIFNYLKIMRRHADNAMRQIFDALK